MEDQNHATSINIEVGPSQDPDLNKEICPLCTIPYDDSSPSRMIQCDGCDFWYHFSCANISRKPNKRSKWFCPNCSSTTLSSQAPGRQQTQSQGHRYAENWLLEVISLGGKVAKDILMQKYEEYCSSTNITPIPRTEIGKIVKHLFPEVTTQRLRENLCGKQIYHYVGISFKEQGTSISDDNFSFVKSIFQMKSLQPTLRRCPKGARQTICTELSKTIDGCCNVNDVFSWQKLLSFSYFVLPSSSQPDVSSCNLTTTVKNNATSFSSISNPDLVKMLYKFQVQPQRSSRNRPAQNLEKKVAAKIAAKISDGDVKGAVKVLTSEDTVAPQNADTLKLLQEKHPEHPPYDKEIDLSPLPQAISITEKDVLKSINTFPNGSASGLDGLYPQILKDLLKIPNQDCSKKLLFSLTSLCNLMLSGRVPTEICPILYGANLIALRKKGGGIRPIAVGNVFRRLTSKIANEKSITFLKNYFFPIQVGCGIRRGAEIGAHSIRSFFKFTHTNPKAMVKLDYKNAFNSIFRDKMLREVRDRTPEIFNYVAQCYTNPSYLNWNGNLILSERGCQQGDPLGPLLFSLTIHPIVRKVTCELNLWYLDDGTLLGYTPDVAESAKIVQQESRTIGLELNPTKCEVSVFGDNQDFSLSLIEDVIPGIRLLDDTSAELLGAGLTVESTRRILTKKISTLQLFSEKLAKLPSHLAFYLLKHSFAIPRIVYILRCSEVWKCEDLIATYDEVLKSTLISIVNGHFNSDQLVQSSLPVKRGGLGVKLCSHLALPGFLSSWFSVSEEVSAIVSSDYVSYASDTIIKEAINSWSMQTESVSTPENPKIQKNWEIPVIDRMVSQLLTSTQDDFDKARLLAALDPMSGSWLNSLPSVSLGTFLQNEVFRIAVSLRLGIQICHPHQCLCGNQIDQYGRHGLSCKRSAGRTIRHSSINDIIKRALTTAECPSILEPNGCSRTDGKRPDGMTLMPWSNGKPLLWDFTCTDTFALSIINKTSNTSGAAAKIAAEKKVAKYSNLLDNFLFSPVAIETTGTWDSQALQFIKDIGNRMKSITGEDRSTTFLIQRISLAIQRGNALSILGATPKTRGLEEIFYILK